MTNPISDTWYILYDGTSDDGCGPGTYCGRTYCPVEAYKHWLKIIKAGPYSVGRVDKVTNTVFVHRLNGNQLKADIEATEHMRAKKFFVDKLGLKDQCKITPKPPKVAKPKVPKPDNWGGFA